MLISPVSVVSNKKNVYQNNKSLKSFKGTDSSSSFTVDETSRKIGMIGSTCLASAVGLLSAGLTSCLVEGRAKPIAVGVLLGGLIGFLSWPSKKAY